MIAAVRAPVLAAALALASLHAAAQSKDEGPLFNPAASLACVEGGGRAECIGLSAGVCMETTPGGWTTMGMAACTLAEAEWWDARLNAHYQELMARERLDDSDWPAPEPGTAPRPSGVESLRDMQRAWIAWRDATCAYEVLQWFGGTGAAVAGAGCRMELTGLQALRLQSYLAEG